jgi:hypothetical protein
VDADAGQTDGAALEVERLARITTHRDQVCDAMDRFVAGYAAWIEDQAKSVAVGSIYDLLPRSPNYRPVFRWQ